MKKRHIFNIAHVSETDDCSYTGTFSCKRLSIKDLAQLSVLKTRLNGGYHHDTDQPGCGVDQATDTLNHMLAHLELSLVDAPDWWDLDEIGDPEILGVVFQEVSTFENSFRKRKGDSVGGGEAGSPAPGEGAVTPRAAVPVVGEEVPAALEP